MAKVNNNELVKAMLDNDAVISLIRNQIKLPATIIGGTKQDGEESIKFRCSYCGHTWTRHYKNLYCRGNEIVECPKCKSKMSPGRKIPESGDVAGSSFELWVENSWHAYNHVLYVNAAELNGEKGLFLAVYDGNVAFYFTDRATHFDVNLNVINYGFISNNCKILFNADGKKTNKMISNAFHFYNCAICATADAMARIPYLEWMKGYVDFKGYTWFNAFDHYREVNCRSTGKSLGEAHAEQTLAQYKLPELPKIENDRKIIFRREISEDIMTGEHSMEYLCKSCGTHFSGVATSYYQSVECPGCGYNEARHGCGDSTRVLTNTAVVTMLDDKTVFIRAGELECKCDEEWRLSHEMNERYRVFITLNPGKDPKVCFLVKEDYGKNVVWKQKKNYSSTKFHFSIGQVEYVGNLDALKYTGFKEFVTARQEFHSFTSSLTLQDMISYIRFQSMYPVIEQLCKRGFHVTLTDEIHYRICHNESLCIDLDKKRITDALSLPERLIKVYLKNTDTHARLIQLQALYRIDENVREEDIDWINLHGVRVEEIGAVINESKMSIMRVCEYLEHVRINQCYEPKNAISDWRDYLRAAKTIEVDLTDNKAKYPSSLKREHDRAIAKQKIILDAKKDETFQAETQEYGKLFSYKGKDYMIIPPKDMKDLFEEGRKLNHCVGSYSDRIIEGTTSIMFIRKVEEPDKPYFTIEISRGGKYIVQLRANSNRLINHSSEKELVKFLREWAKKKNLALNGVV